MSIDLKSLKYLNETQNVSRETLSKLEAFVALTLEWQKAINLISSATVPDIWWRHVVDSAQLMPLIPAGTETVLDIGSGGGFPAIVLAILAEDRIHFTLVESDRRKCIFLREAARVAGLKSIKIITERIEKLPPQQFDLITARALASVEQLLDWAGPYGRRFLFPKGAQYQSEISSLKNRADLIIIEYPSMTDDQAVILDIQKRHNV